ncbi:RagB/SusD family nutrient uptake outer membrane protein [Neolewinella antarctica]|uniref:RagB/SusD domain-containing protein n=1 Tax=Neolewinella antarctica TaxID=442734 RepID=A0ABX0XAE4_9BACT|nr:RagB/SusD family nutrient uptake outer membrane protein [Neolewinella antarctica]NJC26182.1 hypothetical protein [Neolewinella antarctica]
MRTLNILSRGALLLLFSFGLTACFSDLDTEPIDTDVSRADVVYENPDAYEQVLAKLYAGLAVTGQTGATGSPDVAGIDEGASSYLRQLWSAQELPTDEAVVAWGDAGIQDFSQMNWTPSNPFLTALYSRLIYQVTLANEFIREASENRLAERGQTGEVAERIAVFRAEARFLRALSYYHALDLFRNVPFVTEEDGIGAFLPRQIQAGELFDYIESELLAIEPLMIDARMNEYGRADKAAVWMLLSKLYLNAEVYTGQAQYEKVLDYSQRVIDAGYELEPEYKNLYVADNDQSPESIFPVLFDGQSTLTFGGTTFLTHAPVGGSMDPADFGIDGGWGGLRTTSAFVEKFPSVSGGGIVVREPVDVATELPVLNVPGFYQGWDPTKDSTVLVATNPEMPDAYTGFIYFPESDDPEAYQFKVALGTWDNSFGAGEDGTVSADGGNFSVEGPGVYRAEVDLGAMTYNVYKVEFAVIGSATLNGWDGDDQSMTFNPTVGAFEITTPLTAGNEFKFRANDDWAVNYGDDGNDGTLEFNAGNIPVVNGGTYRIRLFLTSSKVYTYAIDIPASDARAQFYTEGQNLEINDIRQFTDGYAVTKYRNVTRDGVAGSDALYTDNDFMVFRLADAYLMYAEAALRTTAGDRELALNYVNRLRLRAYGSDAGNVRRSELTLPFIIDERAREMYWEGHRRQDLIRFGLYTGSDYLWPTKGGAPEGTAVPDFRRVYPIPSSDRAANPNLVQNEGY